jgi:hypothetical protein
MTSTFSFFLTLVHLLFFFSLQLSSHFAYLHICILANKLSRPPLVAMQTCYFSSPPPHIRGSHPSPALPSYEYAYVLSLCCLFRSHVSFCLAPASQSDRYRKSTDRYRANIFSLIFKFPFRSFSLHHYAYF